MIWRRKIAKLWKENIISEVVKRELYERVVIPNVVYDSKTLPLRAQERRKIKLFEMTFLRNIRRVDRVRNSIIRERVGVI